MIVEVRADRAAGESGDLSDDEVAALLEGCSSADLAEVFVAVFYMWGSSSAR